MADGDAGWLRVKFSYRERYVSTEDIADRIIATLPDVKAGSLRMWGVWFGKPYDNVHTIRRCRSNASTLVLEFDGGEALTVDNPEDLAVSSTTFSIRCASAVCWEWFYYVRPHVAENRYFYRFVRSGAAVEAQSNVDWYSPKFSPSADKNAVELL